MPKYRAADLPAGSVIATDVTVAIKRPGTIGPSWSWDGGGQSSNTQVDGELARGAQVLRVGTGKEEG